MGVTIHDDRRKLDAILREIRKLGRAAVTVGVHEDAGQHRGDGNVTVAQVAAVHEFGAHPVPERSFLRSTVDSRPDLLTEAQDSAAAVCRGEMRARVAAERIGVRTVAAVKATIRGKIPPPLSPKTIEARKTKGQHGGGLLSHAESFTPLVDTGQLWDSIQYRVTGDA